MILEGTVGDSQYMAMTEAVRLANTMMKQKTMVAGINWMATGMRHWIWPLVKKKA